MLRQSRSNSSRRSAISRSRPGIGRSRSRAGNGTGFENRVASSFWPEYQPTRARCAASKTNLSNAVAKGAKVVVMSHFGRPKGRDEANSLRPLVEPLSRAIGGRPVRFASDCIGPDAKRVVDALQPGEVALLENLRFHPEEEKNDPAFA